MAKNVWSFIDVRTIQKYKCENSIFYNSAKFISAKFLFVCPYVCMSHHHKLTNYCYEIWHKYRKNTHELMGYSKFGLFVVLNSFLFIAFDISEQTCPNSANG